ncbi:hypothetical protein V6N13_014613 [Hibiscus sabdariffa]
MLPPDVLLRIAAIKCPLSDFLADSVGWCGAHSRKFTLKSAYDIQHGVEEGSDKIIWRIIGNFKVTAASSVSVQLRKNAMLQNQSVTVWSTPSLG